MTKPSAKALFAQALSAKEAGRIDDALAGFDRVTALSPGETAALCEAGLIRLARGEVSAAAVNFEDAVRRHPGNLTALFSLGEARERLGDIAGAITCFSEVIRHRPGFAPARSNLGTLHRRQGSPATAIGHFRKLVRLTPEDAQAHLLLASTFHQARMMEDAVPAFRRALLLSPDNRDTVYNLAVTEPLLGWRETALEHLEWALVLGPLSGEVYARVGRFSARQGKAREAGVACQRALCLAPGLWEAAFTLSGLADDAIGLLQWTVILRPEHEAARLRLAGACRDAGRFGQAEHVLRAGLSGTETARETFLTALYKVMAEDGRYEAFRSEFGDHQSEYVRWIAEHDTPGKPDLVAMSRETASWDTPPLIDIIMPVADPPIAFLHAAIASVKAQIYPHWRLYIADDASQNPAVRAALEEEAATDQRIALIFRKISGHISMASNSALNMAPDGGEGDYVTFLDHDDELTPTALYWMAREIMANPALDLVYSDEDKIDETGVRFDPHFKPDWSPELLLSQNYVCHLALYRRTLVDGLGGLREGYEGSQDHDLALRVSERTDPDRIAHIPRILYHWRAIEGSTARDGDAKPYTIRAGGRAVADHLTRSASLAEVELRDDGFRVRWPFPDPAPLVNVIVPTRDRLTLLRRCVDGILDGTDYPNLSLTIVDNDSSERETLAYLEELKGAGRARILRIPGIFNYSAFNNEAAKSCDGKILCFLNNDTEPKDPGWLSEMVSQACRDSVGAVGAKLFYPDDTVQHAGLHLAGEAGAKHIHIGIPGTSAGYWNRAIAVQNLSAVTGAAMVMRREAFESVDGFDAETFPVDFSDVDLCLRLGDKGYKTLWTPYAALYHHESASRGTYVSHEKEQSYEKARLAMMERYGDRLFSDPYSNPNLDLESLDFKPAFPPRVRGVG